jgi:hypothetical protein
MSLFTHKKWPAKIATAIYNSPYSYILLLLLVIIQFIILAWLFHSFKTINFYTLEQMNSKIDKISSEQNLINEKINGLGTGQQQIQSQLFRVNQK